MARLMIIAESFDHRLLEVCSRHFHLRDPCLVNFKSIYLTIKVGPSQTLMTPRVPMILRDPEEVAITLVFVHAINTPSDTEL